MQNIGLGGVNPMASLAANPGSLGTMGTMQNALAGVSAADPLGQTYSNISPYTASFNNPYNSFMLQSPTRQQQKEGRLCSQNYRGDFRPAMQIFSFALTVKTTFSKGMNIFNDLKLCIAGLSTQQKTHNLFWPDENSIEQCRAAHIVQGCQQY